MLHEPTFQQLVGPTVNAKMDLIRGHGNNAVHKAAPVPKTVAEASIKELFHSLYWFARTYTRRAAALPPGGLTFDSSAVPRPLSPQARALKQAELKAKEAEDEARFKQQAEELAAERGQNKDLARQLEGLKAQIAAAKAANQAVRDTHDYDEKATQDAFIDLLLKEAGWDLLTPGKDTEYPIATGMLTKTGKGYVDYVLWGDDGKPLAVVEVKQARRDARDGQQQAKLYADVLQAQFNRRPVIFYTNGYETYLWDDAAWGGERARRRATHPARCRASSPRTSCAGASASAPDVSPSPPRP
ncbi:type I restriction endonuclease [Streptomyces olivaceus]|uniref:type I restriction endonuclease n=1 Tax=Streptomyces olivaceus TaxID=47716 RepID=UPI001CCCE6A9|nr:type I restriction endonuclease [Streptomyces olivaceus]